MKNETKTIEPEIVEEETPTAIERRGPTTPTTLAELAALKGEALEIVEARVQVLQTLRKAAIRATSPEDWLLFKAPDHSGGQVVGYLQDSGADRVRDLYGIEIFNVSMPEKVAGGNPGEFHYIISAAGRCKLTGQVVENMEGGRSSTDDFCAGKNGVQLDLDVRKAARANLDGSITRELAGLKSVPQEELDIAWNGTNKKIENCRRGRGFGGKAERQGARVDQGAPNIEPPTCELCDGKMDFVPAGKTNSGKPYEAFWSCPKGFGRNKIHDKSTIPHAEYLKQESQKQGEREPGSEG
jgi:hypothetical protein